MDPVFDFHPGGELEDDEVDAEKVELGGNSNPLVYTNADVQDDTVVKVEENRLKRKLPSNAPKPKKERYRSPAWDHFNEIKEGGVTKWVECKYCKKQYKVENKNHDVSNLKVHIPTCPLYPNRDQHGQQNLSFKPAEGGGVDVVTHVFSFDDCKRALVETVIIDELPFRFVKGIGFRKCCKVMQPKFSPVPSRQTTTREGLKDKNESILRVRDVVRYVRSSSQRLKSFKRCVEKEKIVSNQTVCLDVGTQWNSTYLMLEVTVKFKKTLQRMAEEDSGFKTFFGIKEGDDGELVSFKGGETIELQLSTSLFVTSNVFFDEMYNVEVQIDKLIANNNPLLSKMTFDMKKKIDTYWGKGDRFNFLLYVVVTLVPRFKLRWVKFCYTKTKGKGVAEGMEKRVKGVLDKLYDAYANEGEVRVQVASATPSVVMDGDCDDWLSLASEFDT
ncbi:hypothetical protein RHMOL_Rhmol04G0298500 [Rhododendron molle]|uniref:Uncharacterized protein n=1 Tax=Rhododendron molle TaxID=49168 RepID=A0ACC0P5V3_RHOML|nr:hypothetical protein RHMOL_Rhmol04G0298500 [Rhododendron molle]